MTKIKPPDFIPASLIQEQFINSAPCGVAGIAGVSAKDLEAYDRAYDGDGSPADIAIARALDARLSALEAVAPDVAHFTCRNGLIQFASAQDAEDALEELQDWLAESHQPGPVTLIGASIRIGFDPAKFSDGGGSGYGRHSDD